MHFIVSFIISLFHHTQAEYTEFTYKVVILSSLISAVVFVAQYTYYAPWWKDRIGQRIIYETIAIILLLIPSALSLFFNLNRLTSEIVAWYDASMLAAVAGIIIWGIVVWKKERDLVKASIRDRYDSQKKIKEAHPDQTGKQGQVHSDGQKSWEISAS